MPELPFWASFAPTPEGTISPISGRLIKLLAQKKELEVNRGRNGKSGRFKAISPQRARPPHVKPAE
jgi:hypothetical protein